MPLSCILDDFVSLTTPQLGANTQSVLCLMLDLFGWKFDKEGPKSDDFSSSVIALGVVFNLSKTNDGSLEICNTEKRVLDNQVD